MAPSFVVCSDGGRQARSRLGTRERRTRPGCRGSDRSRAGEVAGPGRCLRARGRLTTVREPSPMSDNPPGETARLSILRASRLMDSPPELAFDRMTRLAAHLIGAPVALISLVDD